MTPSWLTIAIRELATDVRELPGAAQNPRILHYHASTRLGALDDETPWCSSFVNWCIERAGLVGTKSAAAASWKTWGRLAVTPDVGAIAVLSRVGGHHVGFVVAATDDTILLLAGNQGNRVSVAPYALARLVALRWPEP